MTSQISTRRTHARATGFLAAALVLVVGALTGCDSSDPDAPAPAQGSFSAALAGPTPASFQGWAAFDDDLDTETGERAFGVGLVTRDSANTFVFVGRGAPAARSYALTADGEDGDAAAFFFQSTGEDGTLYIATEGSLTITNLDTDRMRGRFEFTAASLIDESDTVALSGTFDAPRGSVESDPEKH